MRRSAKLDPPPLPPGAPGIPKGRRYRQQYGVILVVESEAAQIAAFDHLASLGYKPRVVVT